MAEFAQSREYPALEFCFTKYRAGQSTIGQVASFTLHSIPLRAAGTEQDKVQRARALHERLFKATITMQGETRGLRKVIENAGRISFDINNCNSIQAANEIPNKNEILLAA